MKQFNLEEYLKNPSRKVITMDGRTVTRFLCTDAKSDYPIVVLVENFSGSEMPSSYTKDGEYIIRSKSNEDLFFAPKKHEGWVNIYKDDDYIYTSMDIFKTKEKAEALSCSSCIATVKIEWEE